MQNKISNVCDYIFVLGLCIFTFSLLFHQQKVYASNNAKPYFKQYSPFEKIYLDKTNYKEVIDTPEVVKGGHGTFQFILYSGKNSIQKAKIHITPFYNKSDNVIDSLQYGFEGYVGVSKLAPDKSKYSYESPSHLYPDPILEIPSINIPAIKIQPIWISVYIPNNIPAGIYTSTITITGQRNNKTITFKKQISLHVYNVNLSKQEISIANWFSIDNFLKSFNGKWQYAQHDSREWIELLKETAKKLKESHNTSVLISPLQWTTFKIEKGKYSFDFTKFDELVNLFKDCGILKTLEGGFLGQRNGGWESNFYVKVPIASTKDGNTLKAYPITSKEAKQFYNAFIPALYKHIKTKFPDIIYYQHIADEPIDKNSESYIEIARYIKRVCPELRIIETTHTTKIGNYVDVIVPELEYLDKDYDTYKQFQQKGKILWFYTCYLPQGEYANRFIEQPLLMPRLLHWINFKYNVTGYLHWGFNRWIGNPYKETIQDMGGGIILPGGDSWIIYPSESGKIYGSIRLDAMRDGIEDYILLKMLEKKDSALVHKLCDKIILDWTNYNIDSHTFTQTRHKILENLQKDSIF